jgi:hypothetical protein
MITNTAARRHGGLRRRPWFLLLVTLIVSSAVLFLPYFIFANDLAIDKALDAGGRWDYENNRPDQ